MIQCQAKVVRPYIVFDPASHSAGGDSFFASPCFVLGLGASWTGSVQVAPDAFMWMMRFQPKSQGINIYQIKSRSGAASIIVELE